MRDVQIGKVYRHYKGHYYYIKDVAIHSETLEEYVIYYELHDEYKTWVRPREMFLEEIDSSKKDNLFKQKYRFEMIDVKTGDSLEK